MSSQEITTLTKTVDLATMAENDFIDEITLSTIEKLEKRVNTINSIKEANDKNYLEAHNKILSLMKKAKVYYLNFVNEDNNTERTYVVVWMKAKNLDNIEKIFLSKKHREYEVLASIRNPESLRNDNESSLIDFIIDPKTINKKYIVNNNKGRTIFRPLIPDSFNSYFSVEKWSIWKNLDHVQEQFMSDLPYLMKALEKAINKKYENSEKLEKNLLEAVTDY